MTKKLHATGIIVEYNPFHNGHIYHLNQAKEITQCDVLIAVMSPQFVQRGEPAFIDKFQRTQVALEQGVDIVIELPSYYALQAAEHFSAAAITLLKHMKIEDLVYGVEHLQDAKPQFNSKRMDQGQSYAASFDSSTNTPNNILAQAYEADLKKTSIQGHRIQRTNGYFDTDILQNISSATAIRLAHKRSHDTSHTTPMDFDVTYHLSEYESLIKYAIITQDANSLASYLLVEEGIENLFKKHVHLPLDEMIDACVSARYTRSRIKRTLLNIVLGHRKDTPATLDEVRVLGFNAKGQKYLRQIKDDDERIKTSFKTYANKDMELNATCIYNLVKDPLVYEQQRLKESQIIIVK